MDLVRSPRLTASDKGKARAPDPPDDQWDRFSIPTPDSLQQAANCELVGESGQSVKFGQLIAERGSVVVVFLRHLWCGLCQQYVLALQQATHNIDQLPHSRLSPLPRRQSTRPSLAVLPAPVNSNSTASSTAESIPLHSPTTPSIPPLYIILISTGSPSLIPIYKSRLNCPLPLYVDRSRKLYKVLGMTKRTLSGGREDEKGSYITKSKVDNFVGSVANGLSMLRYPGDQKQLGGEMVVTSTGTGPLRCTYMSRMSNTRNHSELRDLFSAAGVKLSASDDESVFGGSGDGASSTVGA